MVDNSQQGKTSTISKFLAVLSLLSPQGGNLCCVYSTSLDRAQEVTRAAKKYLYYYANDPKVKSMFKELGLGTVVFTTDNERTYTLKSLTADVSNTVQARPKNPGIATLF
jgi:phage terminase large subunit-like protein